MLMSIGFSVVFYHTSYHQLGRQLPPPSFYGHEVDPGTFRPEVNQWLRQRIDEGRHVLLIRLVWLNVLALAAGGLLSYILAERTLRPIEEAMEAQSQFVSDASHELRTPLTAIQASNEVALRKPALTLSEAKQVIEQNTEDIMKLKQLSEGLLRLARKDRTTRPPKPVSLQTVASEAMSQIVLAAQAKDITVNDETPNITVLGDKQSLVQVLVNLLSNAVKYSEPHSTINLGGSVKGKYALLYVEDHGMGIREADLPHIFKRFYRVDRSRTKETRDGYGLGLSIADQLIKQYGGEILVSSTPNEGSIFTVKVPVV